MLQEAKQVQDAAEEQMRIRKEKVLLWQQQRKQQMIQDGIAPPSATQSGDNSESNSPAPTTEIPIKKETVEQEMDDKNFEDDDEELNVAPQPVVADDKKHRGPAPVRVKSKDEDDEGPLLVKPRVITLPMAIVKQEAPKQEEEVDPLEAFMSGVNVEVARVNKLDARRFGYELTVTSDQLGLDDDDTTKVKTIEPEKTQQPQYYAGYTPKQHKELGVPDHAKIDYEPFRKEFYVEVPEIARMTEEEVENLRFELENIKVVGKNAPRPVKKWSQIGLSSRTFEVIKHMGFPAPTPIQAQAIPAIMSGRDLMGIAKTGSGKTLAFLLPLFRHVADQRPVENNEGPIALILTPTRELAMQIFNDSKKFIKVLNLRMACIYGGTEIAEQIADLRRGAEIVVCTPGRMIDMLTSNSGRVTNTRRVTYCVLDEADRMFDMGFEPQVMRILDNVRPDRQTVMFSATFPRQMEALARKILKKPVEVQIGGKSVVSNTIAQHVLLLEDDQKFFKLLELLGIYQATGSTIIFVHKQHAADVLQQELLKKQYTSMTLHGGLDQLDRDSNIAMFKKDEVRILIATSVAARGLDVKNTNLVVNYDAPNHYEDYVHRCGRTGRAGRSGTAYTFITSDQGQYAGDIIRALELSKATVPDSLVELWTKFKEERARLGMAKASGSGFGGHGFAFTAEEAKRKKESERSMTIQAHNLQEEVGDLMNTTAAGADNNNDDDDDEEDEGKKREKELNNDIDSQVERLMTKGLKNCLAATAPPPAPTSFITAMPMNVTPALASALTEAAQKAAELTKKLAAKSNPGLVPTAAGAASTAASSFMSGKGVVINKAAEAAAKAAALNKKLGIVEPSPEEVRMQKEAAQPFQATFGEELEVNDFPQAARFRMTRKDTVTEITEETGCAVTIRGQYFPPDKQPKDGERKLHLAIDGTSEQAVRQAISMISRILREEITAAETSFNPQARLLNPGKYKVLAITHH